MDATFAALMNKAKANTQAQVGLALAKQAELEAARKRDAEIEKQNAAREKERKLKEVEARRKREQERLMLEEKLRQEREHKRAQKEKEQHAAPPPTAQVAKTGRKLPSTTEPIPSASTSKVVSVALKKKRLIDAMFSDDEGPSDASTSRKTGPGRHRTSGSTGKSVRGSSALSSGSNSLSAKEKLKLEFDPSQLRSLNENRKDVRTIEEIEQDYRRSQALAQPSSSASPSQGLFASRKTTSSASQSANPTSARGSASSIQDARSVIAQPPDKTAAHGNGRGRDEHSDARKKRRTTSPPEMPARKIPSRSRSPPRKRPASPPSMPSPAKLSKTEARRQEIWAILNPHKAQGPAFGSAYADNDDSDDDDMEAGVDDIEEEDRRAARIARLEDRREEEKLRQRALQKAAKKSGKS